MAGLPMIGSRGLINVAKTVGGEKLGVLADLRTSEDYALAIDEMFDPEARRWEFFQQNIRNVRDKYSWDSLSRAFVNMYGEISENCDLQRAAGKNA